MLCAWSSQYPDRPIPPDHLRSVYHSAAPLPATERITILNRCHRFRGFVYQPAWHRSGRATAQGFGRSLLALPFCRRPVTTNSPNGALSSSPLGASRLPSESVRYAARRVSPLRRCGCRRSSLGRRQMPTDQSLHALTSPLAAAMVVETDGGGISHILRQGFRRNRTCRHLGSGTPDARPDRRHRRR
jgi:hypothetical protein